MELTTTKPILTVCIVCLVPTILRTKNERRWFHRGRPYCSTKCRDRYIAEHTGGRPTELMEMRFWKRVDKNGPKQPHMKTRCWEWVGCLTSGYGKMKDSDGVAKQTTHVSWFLRYGRWPDQFVLHKCDHPSCVRPSHLKLGTQKQNIADMWSRGRGKAPWHQMTEKVIRVMKKYNVSKDVIDAVVADLGARARERLLRRR